MIDKILLSFFGRIDNTFAWIGNLFAPRCKCKNRKKK